MTIDTATTPWEQSAGNQPELVRDPIVHELTEAERARAAEMAARLAAYERARSIVDINRTDPDVDVSHLEGMGAKVVSAANLDVQIPRIDLSPDAMVAHISTLAACAVYLRERDIQASRQAAGLDDLPKAA